MSTELPFRSDASDFLKRLARDVESLKRHTHVDPDVVVDESDFVPPMPPTSPIAASDWQADGARVDFSWTAPTLDTANAPLDDLSYYELRWQYQSAPGWHTVTTDDTNATILGFTGSETLDWQVRAVDTNSNASDWLIDTVVTAADPTPPAGTDTLAPKPPTALSGTGTVVAGTVVTVDYELAWTAPTENVDNSPLTDLMDYEVQHRYVGSTAWTSFTTPLDGAQVSGLVPSVDVEWRVRARDTSGNVSTWATDTITGLDDGTPPDQPSAATLTTNLGTVTATWNGLDVDSDPMPSDFAYLNVYVSDTGGFTPSSATYYDRLVGPGSVVVTGLTVGDTVYIRTIAVDTSGNQSPASTEVALVVQGVTGPDIEPGAVDNAAIDPAVLNPIYDGITQAQTTADGKNTVYYSISPPGSAANVAGDLWWEYDSGTGRVIGLYEGLGGTSWTSRTFDNQVIGTLDAAKIVTGFLDAARIQAGTIDTVHLAADSVTADILAADSVYATALQADSVTAYAIAADSIWAGSIQAEAVTTNNIAVGAITAEKIALGVLQTNLVPDPSFEDGPSITYLGPNTGWRIISYTLGVGGTYAVDNDGGPRSGQHGLRMSLSTAGAPTNQVQVMSGVMPVTPGETYVMSLYACKGATATASRFYARIAGGSTTALAEYTAGTQAGSIQFDAEDPLFAEDVDLPAIAGSTPEPDEYTNFTGQFVIPAGINYIAVRMYNWNPTSGMTIYVDDVSVVKMGQGATEITSAGVRLFGKEGTEIGAFVSNRANYFSVTAPDGATVASISEDGDISGQTVYSENDIQIGGLPLIGSLADFQPITDQPENVAGWMDPLPRGIVGHGFWNNGAIYDFTTTRGIFELAFAVERGRAYRVTFYGGYANNTAAAAPSGYEIRLTNPTTVDTEAATPDFTNSSRILRSFLPAATGYRTPPTVSRILRCNVDDGIIGSGNGELNPGVAKLFVTVTGATSTIRYSANEDLVLFVEDVGPDHPNSKRNNYTESGSGATTTPTTKTYVKEWSTSDSNSYKGSGALSYDQSVIKHGYESYEGNSSGAYQFNYSSIQSALSTAGGRVVVIKKVEVYLYASHWYYNSGGTAYLRTYNATSLPSTRPTAGNLVTSANWPKPGGRWVNVGTAWGSNFQSGAAKGVLIGYTGSTSALYYGRFSKTAKLRITYTVTE